MRSLLLAASLAASGFANSPGWPADMNSLRKAWNLAPADAARRGLWECRKLSKASDRILVRADSTKDGSTRSLEWTAESGLSRKDLPEDVFWAILDGASQNAEWTEADPDILPKAFLRTMEEPASQGFLCRSCKPRLVAATFTRHGATGLRIASMPESAPTISVGLAPGITEDGIRSLASQRSLSVDVANPCKDKGGICTMELGGAAGQKWVFTRANGAAAWTGLDASYQSGAWWSPDWDWDSLRTHSPREFSAVVGAWIGSQADLLANNLLTPIEPILAFPVSSWKNRELQGLRVQAVSDSVAKLPRPPVSLTLAQTDRLRVGIDEFGRRTLKLGDLSK